jgi:hypothetical protein
LKEIHRRELVVFDCGRDAAYAGTGEIKYHQLVLLSNLLLHIKENSICIHLGTCCRVELFLT